MVPLIDMMPVLLVIFIVTAPLLTQAVKLELPKASSQVNDLRPEEVEFAIDAAGLLYWNGEPVSRAEAQKRFGAEGRKPVQTEIHLKADQSVAYRFVARTLADASKDGLTRWASSAKSRRSRRRSRAPIDQSSDRSGAARRPAHEHSASRKPAPRRCALRTNAR